DNALRDASASTLRTRLTFQSAAVNRFSFLLEADNVLTLGADHYDSFLLDRYRGTHSVVADPVGSEINQASVRFVISEENNLTAGRQRLNHGAQRFLGSVGWRQNEQTMDALTFAHAADGFTIDYSYLWNVNRVFKGSRSSVQESDFDSNSHALVAGRRTNLGNFSGFLYAYDFDNAAATSSISYEASYTGTFDALTVAATYARQRDHADNPQPYDADYLMLEGSGKIHLGRVPEWQLRFSWPHHGCRAGDRLDRAGARPAHARGSAPGQPGQTSGAALNFQGIFSSRIHQGHRSRSL